MLITLADAIAQYRTAADDRASNSYNWYRQSAARHGRVWLGGNKVPATRQGRRWMVDDTDVAAAVTAHHEKRAHEARMRTDYDNHVLHAGVVTMTDGGYRTRGVFHFVWWDYQRMRGYSDGHWVCNGCWESADCERNRPECHRCSDWSPCRDDCRLSRVFCGTCDTSLPIG